MRILFISYCDPWPPHSGGAQRIYHILRSFAEHHRITLVTFTDGSNPGSARTGSPLPDLCEHIIEVDARTRNRTAAWEMWAPIPRRVRSLLGSPFPADVRAWESARLQSVLKDLRSHGQFDVVWVSRPSLAEAASRAGFKRVIIDIPDLPSEGFSRRLRFSPWYRSKPIHYLELAKMFCYERLLPLRYDGLVVCKEADRKRLGGNSRKIKVVPNGVEEFPASPPEAERSGELLFLGSMGYQPNVDAVTFFASAIMPRVLEQLPGVQFHVVGHSPSELVQALHNGSSCIVHGGVPDVTPHFHRAAVVVIPIRMGGGTRLKTLEALARGKAVVATTTAAEGLDVRPGIDLEVADDPAKFADCCTRLLRDPPARRRLSESARKRVLDRYSWRRVAEVAEKALAGC